jgi:hypothetical protein
MFRRFVNFFRHKWHRFVRDRHMNQIRHIMLVAYGKGRSDPEVSKGIIELAEVCGVLYAFKCPCATEDSYEWRIPE